MMLHGIIFSFLFVMLMVSAYNYFTAPRMEKAPELKGYHPTVSALVPARNEEKNIGKCLDKIFSSSYGDLEVIVYDDESTDATYKLLEDVKKVNPALKLIQGAGKPEGWTGKSWACHNLYKSSTGEILLFLDADVTISKICIEKAVSLLRHYELSLLSCFPRQRIGSLGEWLVVPLMNWILLALLPLRLIYSLKEASLAAANGQFMLFTKRGYEKTGTHQAVKDKPVEDVALSRLTKKSGLKTMTTITSSEVICRMYEGFTESVNGFTKNFFAGFNMPPAVFLIFIGGLFFVNVAPFVLMFKDISYLVDAGLVLAIRIFISLSSAQDPVVNCLLHPVQMFCMVIVGVRSMARARAGSIYWKGRKL